VAIVAIEVALALVVVAGAGSAVGLVWYGAGIAVALATISLASGAKPPLHASLAVLGLLILARADDRLVLAPVYGASLLAVSELARICHELSGVDHVEPHALRARLLTVAVAAGLGACAASLVSVAVSSGPRRSVVTSVAATVAVAAVYGGIVVLGGRVRRSVDDHDTAGGGEHPRHEMHL
jgi:hypothetical protein